jgi:hypothetical protein
VRSESFYPGWKAWIDDRPTEIHRTDIAFRGVVVPQGKHRVRMEFSSRYLFYRIRGVDVYGGFGGRYMLSLVVPVYDGEQIVTQLLAEIESVMHGIGMPWEAVIVDDGSTDQLYPSCSNGGNKMRA